MTPEEYGRALAADAPPLTDDQAEAAARLYLHDEAADTETPAA